MQAISELHHLMIPIVISACVTAVLFFVSE